MSRKAFPLAWLGRLGALLWRTSQHLLRRGRLDQPLQFGVVCLFLGPEFSSGSASVRHQTWGTPAWSQQGDVLSSSLLEGRRGARSPQAQGKVTTLCPPLACPANALLYSGAKRISQNSEGCLLRCQNTDLNVLILETYLLKIWPLSL